MKIDCIEGWKHTAKLGNITMEDSRVTIRVLPANVRDPLTAK